MCDLCRKLNQHDGTRKVYGNLEDEVLKQGRCRAATSVDSSNSAKVCSIIYILYHVIRRINIFNYDHT